jgi:mannosylglucosylglycerate synthase
MVPNVWDFDAAPEVADEYNKTFRSDFGVKADDVLFIQPTRIVARKGIESAIELVARFNKTADGAGRGKLLVSHPVLDEGDQYCARVIDYASLMNVELIIRPDILDSERHLREDGQKVYSLWDAYVCSDFVTYPSTYEGFGNAFLEAVYYRKPIMVNRYAIYAQDIEPLGFHTTIIDGFVTEKTVRDVISILSNPVDHKRWTEENFQIGKRYLSYDVLRRRLPNIFMNFGSVS